MLKKLLTVLMIVTIVSAMLIACGNNSNNSTETNDTTNITESSVSSDPTGSDTNNPSAPINIDELTYPQYNALTPERQQEVIDSFDSVDSFIQWHNEAKKEHEEFEAFINPDKSDSNTDATDGETSDATVPNETNPDTDEVTFMDYQAMSANEQKRFISSFSSIDAFMQWHADAVQKYKDSMKEWGSDNTPTNPTIETEG